MCELDWDVLSVATPKETIALEKKEDVEMQYLSKLFR